MEKSKSTFKEIYNNLKSVDLAQYTKKKQKLTYLPWANAYNIIASQYDDFNYEVVTYPVEGYENPFYYDMDLGYMVHTKITLEGYTREERLPVLDYQNRAMRSKPYKYSTKSGDKIIDQASMMEINTATKRCFVKNAALFGLGIDLYIGEDVESFVFDIELANQVMQACESLEELGKYYKSNEVEFSKNAQIMGVFIKRKKELMDLEQKLKDNESM